MVVLSEYVQTSILCGPGYVTSNLCNIDPNLEQIFLPNDAGIVSEIKKKQWIEGSVFIFNFLLPFYKILTLNLLS